MLYKIQKVLNFMTDNVFLLKLLPDFNTIFFSTYMWIMIAP